MGAIQGDTQGLPSTYGGHRGSVTERNFLCSGWQCKVTATPKDQKLGCPLAAGSVGFGKKSPTLRLSTQGATPSGPPQASFPQPFQDIIRALLGPQVVPGQAGGHLWVIN